MNFAEKLQMLRKHKGYTQELLSEEIGVSRQAVAKWESGTAFPEISNLIQLSNQLHVTLDYLIKEEECAVRPVPDEFDEMEGLIQFRIRAGHNTYAAQINQTESSRFDSHDFRYAEGQYVYHDSYVGGEQFAGEEAIWRDGRAVYAMNYMGRVLSDTFSGNFLKEALCAADTAMPYRGPAIYSAGEYTYKCAVAGDFSWFQGYEEILCGQDKVYECRFHGGLIR